MKDARTNEVICDSKLPSAAETEAERLARLRAIAAMPDEEIDLTDPDAPEVTDWTGAVRGRFYRPKQP
jgi:hypothetical protein